MISIIVPVYNVFSYLDRCVESLVGQTYRDIEIILVDDGSTDGSEIKCDDWALRSSLVRTVHKSNGGQSSARNLGIQMSLGEWICFVDSDDFVDTRYCEILLETAINNDCLVAACSYDGISDSKIVRKPHTGATNVFSKSDFLVDLISEHRIRFEVWNKIWSRELIGNFRFIEGKNCEEVKFCFDTLLETDRIAYIDISLYHYSVNRPGSTLSSFKETKMYIFGEFDRLKEIISVGFDHKLVYVPYLLSLRYSYNFSFELIKTEHPLKKEILGTLVSLFRKNYASIRKTKAKLSLKERNRFFLFNCFGEAYLKIVARIKG